MEKRTISFSPPDITELEINEVAEALRSGWITTGPRTKELEKRLAEYIGTNRVVCLNSATAAEELNLRVLGIGEGDEVIVPAYTYIATAIAVTAVGAIPVIAEELGAAGYNTAVNDERNKGAFVMGAEAMDINTLLSRSQSLAQSKGKGGEK